MVAIVEACFEERLATDTFEEEEGGGFKSSTDEGGGDASVETYNAVTENRLLEAV